MSALQPEQSLGAVWTFAECWENRLRPVALELLGKGRCLADELGVELAALLLGHRVSGLADTLIAHGADRVYLADHPSLTVYQAEVYVPVLVDLVGQHRPDAILLGATAVGRDLAPTVAATLGTGLSADCIDLAVDAERRLRQMVPVCGSAGLAAIVCPERRPQMATVRPGVFEPLPARPRAGQVVEVPVAPTPARTRVLALKPEERPPVALTGAEVVVAGGAGVNDPEGWGLLRKLAAVLGAEVGGTRPAADDGWVTEDRMIGQSGQTVRPRLYIGVGVSGQPHHTVGIKDAQVVVAVNSDPRAPVFAAADFGIVGDYHQVLPRLIAALSAD